MSAAILPVIADFTGAAVTEGQFKTAFTALHGFLSELQTKAADIASATTCDIGSVAGNYVKITGTTTITGLGTSTAAANTTRTVLFGGALILTHNATSLILPGGANITTAAGDIAQFVHEGSGNWRCTAFLPTAGYARVGGSAAQDFTAKIITAAGLLDLSGAAAGQIKFPATQNASADANTFDDYEEGTWTPTGNGITFTSAAGQYTKKGREATIHAQVTYPATANTNQATVGGVPFVSAIDFGAAIGYTDYSTSGFYMVGYSVGIYPRSIAGANLTNANFSTVQLRFSATYNV